MRHTAASTTAEPVAFGPGFFQEEANGLDRFRWMGQAGSLTFSPSNEPRYLELWILSEFLDLSQELACTSDTQTERYNLVAGWAPLSVPIEPGAARLDLQINKVFPNAYYPSDNRTLAARMRPPLLHQDPVRDAHIRRQYHNCVDNVREMLDRHTTLDSTPITLGIDLYGVCNVKPPCVYCEWDHSKDLEGAFVDAPFTPETLREWGPFFDNSVNLVNCSIGEPFMMKEFDDLLDAFGNSRKVLEMTTNGQILTDQNIQKLLGRTIDLYVSLDAGTPETYAKLRNDRFDGILHNLRRLIAAKGGPGHQPHVHLVFMPMRVNVHELESFIRICADLRVDRMILRPLNNSPSVSLDFDRAGYRFEYQKELLPFDELVRVSGRAAQLCQDYGVELADQMDFGGAMGEQFERLFEEGRQSVQPLASSSSAAPSVVSSDELAVPDAAPASAEHDALAHRSSNNDAPAHRSSNGSSNNGAPETSEPLPSLGAEQRPACTEPWKSLYVLRRGVFPCCYGGSPVAPMDQYREAWNGPEIREIRAELVKGRFPDYCLRSPSCPIVQKSAEAGALPSRQIWLRRARNVRARLDKVGHGRLADVLWAGQWLGGRVTKAVTDPRYVARHIRRLLGLRTGQDGGEKEENSPARD